MTIIRWIAIVTMAVVAYFLAGCSLPMHHFTWPTGRTDPDFERDTRLCNLDAQTMQWNIWLVGGRLGFRPADHWFVFDFQNYDRPSSKTIAARPPRRF